MAQKSKQVAAAQAQQRQSMLVDRLKTKEQWMKWAIIAAVVVILLLLLLLGYATDWTRGLRKDSATTETPLASSLDSARSADTGTANTANGGNGTNGGDGSNGTNGNGSSTDRTSTSTTTNSSTTTNNNTTDGTPPPAGLLSLYADSTAGDNIQDVIDQANELGIAVECTEDLVVQTCVFTEDGKSVTVKNLRLTGTVTSVLKDFQLGNQ